MHAKGSLEVALPPTSSVACLIRLISLPWREFLDTLSQAFNAVVIYQPIWSLRTFGMPAKLEKLSLRMTTSIVPKESKTFIWAILDIARIGWRL